MNPATLAQTLAADIAALDAAATLAEEALAYHRQALVLLAEGWQSETGSAIADFMNLQCVHAADVVDALRRAAGELPESQADPAGDEVPGRPVDQAGVIPPLPVATPPADPTAPIAPAPPAPAPAPDPVSAWTAPTSAAWNAPPPGTPWAAPGGLSDAASPSLPDLGGALAGLVAEIAQALGSYADAASPTPADDLNGRAADPLADVATPADQQPAQTVTNDHTDGPVTPGSGPAPPVSLPPADPSLISAPPAAPPELLAAERPPEPEAAVAPAPGAETPGPGAEAPGPAPASAIPPVAAPPAISPPVDTGPVESPPAAPPAEAEKAPCEIAADELPKVGE